MLLHLAFGSLHAAFPGALVFGIRRRTNDTCQKGGATGNRDFRQGKGGGWVNGVKKSKTICDGLLFKFFSLVVDYVVLLGFVLLYIRTVCWPLTGYIFSSLLAMVDPGDFSSWTYYKFTFDDVFFSPWNTYGATKGFVDDLA